ncbi:unnamed protein product [Caenorhabditis auriculariae]|uniref:Uncharacterized protein n=1 Tax=Caenorhabditis auriculariae TaxID=2777116 RepID=A0A8S1HR45_9PELO|nr:unnamed protein product [Caenorhabditis auriculariae]
MSKMNHKSFSFFAKFFSLFIAFNHPSLIRIHLKKSDFLPQNASTMRAALAAVLLFVFHFQTCSGVRAALRMRKRLSTGDENSEDDDYLDEQERDEVYNKAAIFEQGETHDFLQFLRSIKYDHRQVPDDVFGGPVAVNVSIVVSNIRAVSEVTMDYCVEMFYRENWRDPRLIYSINKFKKTSKNDIAQDVRDIAAPLRLSTEISLHESYSNFLWHPDTFVPNAIASKNPRRQSITHRSLLRLRHDGSILYSRRLSLVLTCGMDLTLFPFDTQLCKMGIESYGYTADQVRYMWSTGYIQSLTLHKIRLPDFQVKEAFVTSRVESYATGDYSRLYVCFVFNRAAGFCFLQLIIPSTAVVITSWVSLWMENETSFQDMISIILTITFLLFSYNEVMPRVSYIKAMDVYLGVCFCIVFLSLIKLAVVKYMRQRLLITRDTSIVAAGIVPMLRIVNGVSSPATASASFNFDQNGSGLPLYTSVQVDKHGSTSTVDQKPSRISWFEFTPTFVHRFHWITQMAFFFGFVVFCLFYFLVYPNIHSQLLDEDCDRNGAEWFADVN